MRIGRLGTTSRARSPRHGTITNPPATKRHVRTERLGFDVARIDYRTNTDGEITSVTIASHNQDPLSAHSVGLIVNAYASAAHATGHQVPTFRTPAITNGELHGYVANQFQTTTTLTLLSKNLDGHQITPATNQVRLLRGRRHHVDACATLDHRAFGPTNAFDGHDITAALEATERVRFRIAVDTKDQIIGYAITGRAGKRGYLQRLAVTPNAQRSGIGGALVSDSVHWCQRKRVAKMVVNTHHDNTSALRLYRRFGFVDTGLELFLLERRA